QAEMTEPLLPMLVVALIDHRDGAGQETTPRAGQKGPHLALLRKGALTRQHGHLKRYRRRPSRVSVLVDLIIKLHKLSECRHALWTLNLHAHSPAPSECAKRGDCSLFDTAVYLKKAEQLLERQRRRHLQYRPFFRRSPSAYCRKRERRRSGRWKPSPARRCG